jgi:hypothetical protein
MSKPHKLTFMILYNMVDGKRTGPTSLCNTFVILTVYCLLDECIKVCLLCSGVSAKGKSLIILHQVALTVNATTCTYSCRHIFVLVQRLFPKLSW